MAADIIPPDGFDEATGHVWNGSEWIEFTGTGEETTQLPSVRTLAPTGVGQETATLEGSLDSMGTFSSVSVYFEWRASTSSSWNEVASFSRSSTGPFDYELGTVLDPDTEYEYRAVAEADGNRTTGSTVTFTTDEAGEIVIDDFEGSVDSAWMNTSEFGTSTQVQWNGSYSAYRSGSDSIRAGPNTFDATFEQGGPFVAMPVHTTASNGLATFDFGRSDSSTLAGYTIRVDWQPDGTSEIRIAYRETSEADYTVLESASASIAPNSWYELIGFWHEDDTIHAWLYDSDGSLVASIDVMGEGVTGDWWAIYLSPSEQTFIDYVRILDTHPYTFDHYSDVPASTNDGSSGGGGGSETSASGANLSNADVYEPFDDSSYTDTFAFEWSGGLSTYRIEDAPGRAGNQFEIELWGGEHYGADFRHSHEDATGSQYPHVYQRFMFRFDENFEVAQDGKLHGFLGNDDSWGLAGEPADGTSWMAQMGWSNQSLSPGDPVPLEWYIYHMDQSGSYGDHDACDHQGSQYYAPTGQWLEFEQEIDLGTPGVNDAELRTWVDGTLIYERTNLHFRNSGGNDVKDSFINIYHGGSSTAPSTVSTWTDDFYIHRNGVP